MKQITLTQGKVAIVDDDLYEELSQWKWHAHRRKNTCYAMRRFPNRKVIYMHTFIMQTPVGMDTDHINGDGLDNRRCNLRSTTHRENMQNLHIKKTSRFPGVHWNRTHMLWHAEIQVGARSLHLGCFSDEDEAHSAYLKACAAVDSGNEVRTARIINPKSSRYRGVYWDRGRKKWAAQIRFGGKNHHLGYFTDEEEAHSAHLKASVASTVVTQ